MCLGVQYRLSHPSTSAKGVNDEDISSTVAEASCLSARSPTLVRDEVNQSPAVRTGRRGTTSRSGPRIGTLVLSKLKRGVPGREIGIEGTFGTCLRPRRSHVEGLEVYRSPFHLLTSLPKHINPSVATSAPGRVSGR